MADTAVDQGAAAGGAGMPQLDISSFPNQIFWLVVTLIVLYLILSRVALPRIGAVLAERQGTITNDIAAAEELKLKAQQAEVAYEKALADARAKANAIISDAKVEIQATLDAQMQHADAEIAAQTAESEKAIAEIEAGASDAVKTVAKDAAKEIIALLGGKADAKTITAAVTARMKG